MAKSKKQSSKTSKTSVNDIHPDINWQGDARFATLALESRAQTTAWALNQISRNEGPGNNLQRSEAIIGVLDEFAGLLFGALNLDTDHDFLFLASMTVTFFIAHLIENHNLPNEHISSAIDMMTFYCARFYHNMEPKT